MSFLKIALSLLCCLTGALCMRIPTLQVPSVIELGGNATLECLFDPGDQTIVSVRWKKSGVEFYRYTPKESPPNVLTGNVSGIEVDVEQSDQHRVQIRAVSLEGSGLYECKVIAEGPNMMEANSVSSTIHVITPEQLKKMRENGSPRTSAISPWILMSQMALVAIAASVASGA